MKTESKAKTFATLNVVLSHELREKLDRLCTEEGVVMSFVVRKALEEYFAKHNKVRA